MIDAYNWAYSLGITTMPTIEEARLDDGITRGELAKMMVVFVSQVLGKKPIKKGNPHYWDVSTKLR